MDDDISKNGLLLENQKILPQMSEDDNPFSLKLEKEQEIIKQQA